MSKEEITQRIEELARERNSLPLHDFERARIMDQIASLQHALSWP